MEIILILALASGGTAFTITTTSMFEWLRELVSKLGPKFEELIHCPWCLGHYITLILMFSTLSAIPRISGIDFIVVFILLWFTTVALSGFVHYVLLRAYEPVGKAMARRVIEKLKKKSLSHLP